MNSLNMTVYLCYYLRINNKEIRKEFSKNLDIIYKDFNKNDNGFLDFPEEEIKNIISKMNIDKSKGIALNRPLRENLFTIFICFHNNIPLIIVGKPETGKSLSVQIIKNTY